MYYESQEVFRPFRLWRFWLFGFVGLCRPCHSLKLPFICFGFIVTFLDDWFYWHSSMELHFCLLPFATRCRGLFLDFQTIFHLQQPTSLIHPSIHTSGLGIAKNQSASWFPMCLVCQQQVQHFFINWHFQTQDRIMMFIRQLLKIQIQKKE